MSERFLQLNIENEIDHEGDWLAANHPNAFILLYFIARRARRISGLIDGLEIGTAKIGDWKQIGLSRQNYRTALKVLTTYKFIKILETNRTRKKSTNGSTTEGTLVKILDSRVWDINSDVPNHRPNHCLTTDQPLTNHERRKNKKEKKEEEIKQPLTPSFPISEKINFRENVKLTQTEHDSLLTKHGIEIVDMMLNILDAYKGSSGKKYNSDFHTMKEGGWVLNRAKEDLSKQKISNQNERAFKSPPEVDKPSEPRYQPNKVLRGSNTG